jgi:hypothetical protein
VFVYAFSLTEGVLSAVPLAKLGELLERQGDAIAESASRAAERAGGLAGKAAGEIAEAVVGWLLTLVIDVVSTRPFPTLWVVHKTIRAAGLQPLSVVSVCRQDAGSTRVEALALGRPTTISLGIPGRPDPPGPIVDDGDVYLSRGDRFSRFWFGVSTEPPALPASHELNRRLHRQNVPPGVQTALWREPPQQGMGVIVRLPHADGGEYSVALRADVRIVPRRPR